METIKNFIQKMPKWTIFLSWLVGGFFMVFFAWAAYYFFTAEPKHQVVFGIVSVILSVCSLASVIYWDVTVANSDKNEIKKKRE